MKNNNYKLDIVKLYENFILNESYNTDGDDDTDENPSETAGFEVGETNYQHGKGYPNKFLYDNYDDKMQIGYIVDVSENENEEYHTNVNNWFMDHIKNNFKHNMEFVNKMEKFFKMTGYTESLYANHWWQNTLESDDISRVNEIYDKLLNLVNDPTSTQESENYPLYVSLYDITKVYMGEEEGGYWPTSNKLVKSIKVQNPKQMENTAKHLLNLIDSYDMDGIAKIYVERQKGSQTKTPKSWLEAELE